MRLRGSVAVSVASIAPPSRPSEAASHNGPYPLSSSSSPPSSDRLRVANGAEPRVGPSSALEAAADPPSPTSIGDSAATLERTASSGQATTSGPSASSSPVGGGHRRRFIGSKAASATSGAQSRGGATASRSFFDPTREFQPREFTSHLAAASSVSELQQLFEAGRKHDINAIHIATVRTVTCTAGAVRRGGTAPAFAVSNSGLVWSEPNDLNREPNALAGGPYFVGSPEASLGVVHGGRRDPPPPAHWGGARSHPCSPVEYRRPSGESSAPFSLAKERACG